MKNKITPNMLTLVENNTLMLVEVIDGRSLSIGPITHETKALGVTIGYHTNKVVFNVISSPKIMSSLDCLGLFYIIHEWINIQGIFILKHHNMRPWSVKPLSKACKI
jgi:hypothetical protein